MCFISLMDTREHRAQYLYIECRNEQGFSACFHLLVMPLGHSYQYEHFYLTQPQIDLYTRGTRDSPGCNDAHFLI